MKDYIREIKRGKNLELALPKFFTKLADTYYKSALYNLTFHFICICEEVVEEGMEDEVVEVYHVLWKEIKECFFKEFDGKKREEAIERLDNLRNLLKDKVDVLAAYTDRLALYSYILERKGPNFQEIHLETPLESFLSEVYHFIFDTEETFLVNAKINFILRELPTRLTKAKFFDILTESLKLYKGVDLASLLQVEYMVKTASMIYIPDGLEKFYPEVYHVIEELSKLNYQNLTKEEWEKWSGQVESTLKDVEYFVNQYMQLGDFINELYTLLLTVFYADAPSPQEDKCLEIIERTGLILENLKEQKEDIVEELEKGLDSLEGILEEKEEELLELEAAFAECENFPKELLDSLMLRPLFEVLKVSILLHSDSTFVDLGEEENTRIVTEELIKEHTEQLIQEFTEAFEGEDRLVRRARMAFALKELPVFLNDRKEVMNYIRTCLESCTDKAERYASIQTIKEYMELDV